MTVHLSQDQARTIAVASQGLEVDTASIEQVFARVKCLQVDPLKAVRESHEVVCLSRGALLDETVSLLQASTSYQVFAYPAHAMALLPMHLWPWFASMRRRLRANGWRGPAIDPEAIKTVTSLLNERQVVTTKDFSGGTGTGWQRVSPLRIAAEWLLWTGEVVSTSRKGVSREYALASKVIPRELQNIEPSDDDCLTHLISESLDALGVATDDDIADYFRLRKDTVSRLLQEREFTPATVEGWSVPTWISQRAGSIADIHLRRVVPLSPFDSLVWYRPRLQRLFGKTYSFEAYKPAAKRTFGHYFVPILVGNCIVGRVSPRRSKGTLIIEAQEFDTLDHQDQAQEAMRLLHEWSEAEIFQPFTEPKAICEQ